MSDINSDPASIGTVTAPTGGCCDNTAKAAAPEPAAAPCCGSTAQATAEGSCCGTAAKTEAVAAGQGCCG